jgi:MFS family permease
VVSYIGTRTAILIETGFFGVGLAMVASGKLALMMLGSVLLGVAYGLNNPASSEILEPVVPRARRNLIFSIKQAGVPIGAVLANLAAPALVLAFGGSWRMAVLAGTAMVAVMFVALWRLLHVPPQTKPPVAVSTIISTLINDQRHILQRPDQRALAFLGGVYSASQLMVTAFVVVTLVQEGWTPVQAGMVGASMHALGASGRISWGLVADRFGCFQVLSFIGVVIAALSFAAIFLGAAPGWAQAGCFILLGFVASGWNGVMLAGIAQGAPEGRVGANTGAALVYTFVGVIIGPSVFAGLYSLLGTYTTCFALVTLMGLTGAVLSETARRRSIY